MAKEKKQKQILPKLTLNQCYDKVLGLDVSLTGTGWCKTGQDTTMWNSGVIETKGMLGHERKQFILDNIKTKLDKNMLVIIEGYSFASKGSSIIQIAEMGGIIRHYLFQNGYKYIEIAPTTLKKYATGKGNTDKALVLKEVYKNWKMDFFDDNECDAFVLGAIGKELLESNDFLKAYQKEVIKQIKELNNLA